MLFHTSSLSMANLLQKQCASDRLDYRPHPSSSTSVSVGHQLTLMGLLELGNAVLGPAFRAGDIGLQLTMEHGMGLMA